MNLLNLWLISVITLIASCRGDEGNNKSIIIESNLPFTLIKTDSILVDESKKIIGRTSHPKLFNDSLIALINNNAFCIYNSSSGKLLNEFKVDQLDFHSFLKEHIKIYFKDIYLRFPALPVTNPDFFNLRSFYVNQDRFHLMGFLTVHHSAPTDTFKIAEKQHLIQIDLDKDLRVAQLLSFNESFYKNEGPVPRPASEFLIDNEKLYAKNSLKVRSGIKQFYSIFEMKGKKWVFKEPGQYNYPTIYDTIVQHENAIILPGNFLRYNKEILVTDGKDFYNLTTHNKYSYIKLDPSDAVGQFKLNNDLLSYYAIKNRFATPDKVKEHYVGMFNIKELRQELLYFFKKELSELQVLGFKDDSVITLETVGESKYFFHYRIALQNSK